MGIRVASVLRYRHGRFSQRLLERDLDTIRDLYRSNGFRDVVATGKIAEAFKGKAGTWESTSKSWRARNGGSADWS